MSHDDHSHDHDHGGSEVAVGAVPRKPLTPEAERALAEAAARRAAADAERQASPKIGR